MIFKCSHLLKIAVFFILTSICACGDDYSNGEMEENYNKEMNIIIIEDSVDHSPVISETEYNKVEPIIRENNESFALKKIRDLSFDENVIFSPFNITLTYSMMMNGANKEEYEGIRDYINSTDDIDTEYFNTYYERSIETLNESSPKVDNAEVAISNKIWVREKTSIYRSFISVINKYRSQIEGVDFESDSYKIDDEITSESSFGPSAIKNESWNNVNSIITNSMRFNMQWYRKYNIYKNEDFISGTDTIKCRKFGFQGYAFAYDSFYKIVELPYNDSNYSMFVVYTPFTDLRHYNTINDIIAQGGLTKCIENMQICYLDFKMPIFELKSVLPFSTIEENDTLVDGLKFYSNISNVIFELDDIYQVCSINVTEAGTSVKSFVHNDNVLNPDDFSNLGSVTLPPKPDRPLEVNVDKPFWFFIRNNELGCILYCGYVKTINNQY